MSERPEDGAPADPPAPLSGDPTRLRAPSGVAPSGVATDASTPEAEVGPGTVLGGRYRLLRVIGRGGMGEVFLAESTVDAERFAIKVLNAEFREHPDAVKVMREEARKSLVLRHPNIVGVFPLERDGPNHYLPMEFLDGKTLRQLLDQDFVRGMPLQQAWSIIRGVGAALAFAHDRGVIHSDLKPSNIFVTIGGSARVLDFGIARALRADRQRFDTGTLGALTEGYASSEMLAGEAPDFRDDIYGLACVVYELLTGSHPFGGKSAVQAHEAGLKVPPVRGLTGAQNAALARGLAFRKADRSASLEEFLGGVCGDTAVPSVPRRTGAVRWLAVAVILAALAAGGWWWWRQSPLPGLAMLRGPAGAVSAPSPAESAPANPQTDAGAGTDESRAHQVGSGFTDCTGCPRMVVVPAGIFRMSSSREEAGRGASELAQRLVQFTRPFAIGRVPVTRGEFQTFLTRTGRTPSGRCADAGPAHTAGVSFRNPGFAQTDEHPAVCVSADDASAYADWINRQVGSSVYRLPTEAEWEYAARAGSRTPYAWGENEADACRYGNFGDLTYARRYRSSVSFPCEDGYPYTAPVGSFPANAWKIDDMPGNVREWTRGCPHDAAPHVADDGSAWSACREQVDVVRGAGFATLLGAAATRVSVRLEAPRMADATTNETGFRLVRPL